MIEHNKESQAFKNYYSERKCATLEDTDALMKNIDGIYNDFDNSIEDDAESGNGIF